MRSCSDEGLSGHIDAGSKKVLISRALTYRRCYGCVSSSEARLALSA